MNFIQPSIDPVILSIGFIEIRWYSLAYILGFLLGIYIIKRLNAIYGNQYSNKNIDSFLIWAVLGVIIGGRTGYVIFYQLYEFLTNPFYLFEIWNGGYMKNSVGNKYFGKQILYDKGYIYTNKISSFKDGYLNVVGDLTKDFVIKWKEVN